MNQENPTNSAASANPTNSSTFPSLTAEAKYHILHFLSENRDGSHSCFEITQAVQQQNEAIRDTIISGALHTLWNSGRIIKPSRGRYQINLTLSPASPSAASSFPGITSSLEGQVEQNAALTVTLALEKSLACISSVQIRIADIDDPEAFLLHRQILIDTNDFIEKQLMRLK